MNKTSASKNMSHGQGVLLAYRQESEILLRTEEGILLIR